MGDKLRILMNKIEKITLKKHNELAIGGNIYHCKEIISTNTIILDNADGIFSNGDILFADIQTEGVGRYNRKWDSQKGGLYFSILFQQVDDLQKFYRFVVLTALAVKEELEELTNDFQNFKIKWPNDIYYKDKKICGILTQTKIQGEKIRLVIGIGINVNNTFSRGTIFSNPPISLKEIVHKKSNVYNILQSLINKINYYYNEYNKDNFHKYLIRLNKSIYKRNEKIKFTKDDKTILVRPLEFSQNGYLVCEVNGQQELFSIGEIE